MSKLEKFGANPGVYKWINVWNHEKLDTLLREFPGVGLTKDGYPFGWYDGLEAVGRRLGVEVPADPDSGAPAPHEVTPRLYPYQQAGAEWLMAKAARGCILADDMGLGKSCQAITAVRYLRHADPNTPMNEKQWWVICPAGVRAHWKREIRKWDDGMHIARVWQVVSYEELYNYLREAKIDLSTWPCGVICDEAQILKKATGPRYQQVAYWLHRRRYRIFLSGTPIDNITADSWGILDLCQAHAFGSFYHFAKSYCQATRTSFGWSFHGTPATPELAEEFRRRLRFWVLRRTLADVAPGTRSTYETIPVGSPSDLPEAVYTMYTRAAEFRQSVVCYTYTRELAKIIWQHLYDRRVPVFLLTGEQAPDRREAEIARARKRSAEESTVTVATISAAGLGIELDYATKCVFAQLEWRVTAVLQAIRRLVRVAKDPSAQCQVVFLVPRVYDGAYGRAAEIVIKKVAHLDILGPDPEVQGLRDSLAHDDNETLARIRAMLGSQNENGSDDVDYLFAGFDGPTPLEEP